MSKVKNTNHEGWNLNTDLCVDVKTFLRTDRITQLGKNYAGLLTRDRQDHYSFIETMPWNMKRNPYVFRGKYVTITRKDDGTLRPNFRPMKVGANFSVDGYAHGVANELRMALTGLIEK